MRVFELVLPLAMLTTGCGAGYKVVRQTTPNPMTTQATFSIQRMNPQGAGVEDADSALKVVSCFEEEIAAEGGDLGMSQSPGAPFVVRPSLTSLSRSQLVVQESVDAALTVTITNAQGQELDVFTSSVSRSKGFQSVVAATRDSAACQVGTTFARVVMTYVKDRTGR